MSAMTSTPTGASMSAMTQALVRRAAAVVVPTITERWYSVTLAAEKLGYTPRNVRHLCETGRIEGARQLGPGAHWRIPRAWVDREMTKGVHAVIRRQTPEKG